ncbi:MAG TPA: glycyl-radical enzyme activating protein [Prolixibacteraceae bacterium]|nr:glycyl-radical enzyme activating protein [Prolixibacteraceae bacterium]
MHGVDDLSGIIFDVKHYAIRDGPGIRTTVFFKGCPLRCLWCDNPESQNTYPELLFYFSRCARLRECVKVCPAKAIIVQENDDLLPRIDRLLCSNCGLCADMCVAKAMVMIGKRVTGEALLNEVLKDVNFYRRSGGGVTASGGEPAMQSAFVSQFFKECQTRGIRTTLDTCGQASWEDIRRIADYTDLILYDVKHIDRKRHKEYTGVSNDLIIENLKRLSLLGIPIIIRVPIIPGYNDSEENMTALSTFLTGLHNIREIDFLPYNRLGLPKYEALGKKSILAEIQLPTKEKMLRLREITASYGLNAKIVV